MKFQEKKNLVLPAKDSGGNQYLSYSQIDLFLRSKKEYYNKYILKQPIYPNKYMKFGLKVGRALEKNNYSKFEKNEISTLKDCIRLNEFEKRVKLEYDNFYVLMFIDTISEDMSTIIDYKTGNPKYCTKYIKPEYVQLCYYALGIRQTYGITPDKAYVNFIPRVDYRDRCEVGNGSMLINIDISYQRLKHVYWNTINIANQISDFYEKYKPKNTIVSCN